MGKIRMLSGDEIVARGTTKTDASLPELGLKDVVPNGSWLEKKQIQSALEARKHLIEVERIEKSGTLSHAEWREDLMLAEVTQKVGGHWQFLSHNVGKTVYLHPEEALFLMEVNSLQLKYNEVTVSLQQAYSLLLCGKITLIQYKVYASLSRLGYKVFRHDYSKPIPTNKNIDENVVLENVKDITEEKESDTISVKSSSESSQVKMKVVGYRVTDIEDACAKEGKDTVMEVDSDNVGLSDLGNSSKPDAVYTEKNENEDKMETNNVNNQYEAKVSSSTPVLEEDCKNTTIILSRLQMLELRKVKETARNNQNHLENIPDLFETQIITLKAPEKELIPENVVLNNSNYTLYLENVRNKPQNDRSPSTGSRTYSRTEEVNGANVRRITATANNDETNRANVRRMSASANMSNRMTNFNPMFNQMPRFPGAYFRPYNVWRPRINLWNFHMMFQRPFLRPFVPSMGYMPRFQPFFRPPFCQVPNFTSFFSNNRENGSHNQIHSLNRKRRRNTAKNFHLRAIRNLAGRLKQLVQANSAQNENIEALQRLIQTYNIRYTCRVRLTNDFDVADDETILETIELDDEEESKCKRQRKDENDKYEENLNSIKHLALKLRNLPEDQTSSRHRRAFSNVLKRFNKCYNAELNLTDNYEVLDRKRIVLDSSDSDCVIEEHFNVKNEVNSKTRSRKKLRNPFNILKRLAQKHNASISSDNTNNYSENGASTSTTENRSNNEYYDEVIKYTKSYNETMNGFDKNWLPYENDFGRAEVPPQNHMYQRLVECKKDEYLYDFIKSEPYDFDNWLDIKISFLRSMEAAKNEFFEEDEINIHSLIGPNDCTDTGSVLKKLSIIPTCKEVSEESCLNVHFDVYERDIQNFRKSNRPKPHFRVICVDESSQFPSGIDVATLHSRYGDNVAILFAVVGAGSISYLQINHTETPVYIPSNDLV